MTSLPAPMTQAAYRAVEQFRGSRPRADAEPDGDLLPSFLLWLIAQGRCQTAAELHRAFRPDRTLAAALDRLLHDGLLVEQDGALGASPSGHDALGLDRPSRFPAPPELRASGATYALDARLATGAQGEVWMARQTDPLERRVAIKLVAERGDAERNAMLFREAAVLADLAHSGIPAVGDTGVTGDGRPFVVMEFVAGRPLDEFCDRNELPLGERLRLFLRVCAIVHHVHAQGYLHRDLKPQNILVTPDPDRAVKLIDFGLALSLDGERNQPGRVQGTPTHMSPEQASGAAELDQRADVHGLGVILFELATGLSPVREADLVQAGRDITGVVGAAKVRASEAFARAPNRWELAERRGTDAGALRRALQGGLDPVIERALAVDREARHADVASLAADVGEFLAEWEGSGHAPRVRVGTWLLALLAVATVAFVAGAVWGGAWVRR
ncbi:MAG: serine/threonine protein kinase [Planctomycetes bacterium]|nr:serine/threonine protein kinase [Planctomycetota bacterium]